MSRHGAYAIEYVTNADGLSACRDAWNTILEADPGRTIFVTPQMFTAWWQATKGPDDELCVQVVRRDDAPVGVAPMILRRAARTGLRTLELCAPRSDILAGKADRGDVIDALVASWAATAAHWDVVALHEVPERSGTLQAVAAASSARGWRVEPIAAAAPHEAHLPTRGGWAAYLASRSVNFRRNVQRLERNAARRHARYRRYCEAGESADAMAQLVALEDRSWKAEHGDRLSPADRSCFLAFTTDASGAFRHEFTFLDLDGTPAAGLFSVTWGGCLHAFVTCYDARFAPAYPGRTIVTDVVRRAFDTPGVTAVSFIGDSPFVRSWTSLERTYASARIYSRRPRSVVARLAQRWHRRGRSAPAPRLAEATS